MFKRIDLTKIATWGYGLAAAFIAAAANAAGTVLVGWLSDGQLHWKQLIVSCGITGAIAAFAYLKSSPLPPDPFITVLAAPGSTTTVTTTNPPTETTNKKTP